MSTFEPTFLKVVKVEGDFTDGQTGASKFDKGGATRFGITISTLKQYRGVVSLTANDVKNLSLEEAKLIYKKLYWDPLALESVDSHLIADILFDQGVNRGVETTILGLQRVLNAVFKCNITVDGKMGPESLRALNACVDVKLALALIKSAQNAYINIVVQNPAQIVFLRGWINRTHKLLDLIA